MEPFILTLKEMKLNFFADASFFLSESKNNKYICLPAREVRAHQLEASLFTFVFLKIAISERLIAHDF